MTLEGLPKQFLSSVKVLFDVLDSKKQGFINLKDVEAKWNKENTNKLPADVIECLRHVSPPSGHLTFDLFVTGLRKSLQPPRLSHQGYSDEVFDENQPPPKPNKPLNLQHSTNSNPYLHHTDPHYPQHKRDVPEPIYQRAKLPSQGQFDGGRSQSIADIPAQPITSPQHRPTYRQESDMYRRQVPKRRESARRHTLGHGVDGSMLRRSKLLEEERRMLLKGLQAVDKAKDWYSKRLIEVADKQRYGAPETSDQSTDQQQERINFEQLRITELNQQIDALTEPSAQGGLMRMNLARTSNAQGRQQTIPYEPVVEQDSAHVLQLMRAQNRMLTKEVSQKGDRISQLEKEKATLLQDLFEVRAKNRVTHHQQLRTLPPPRQFDESTSTLM